MTDLLIELFSEEIPARMQTRAANDLKKLVTDGMVEAGLTYASAAAFSTPRRLTLTVEGMLDASPTTVEERKGPKADAPEKAIEGFLRGAGLTRDDLEERETPKGNIFFAKITKEGRPAADIVAEVLERTIRNFPWPKSMRWGNGTLKWVRPLHSILCITSSEEGATVVPLEVDGIISGNTTHGHRFLSPGSITVNNFDDYTSKLKSAHVVLDAQERADAIWNDATNQAFATGFEVGTSYTRRAGYDVTGKEGKKLSDKWEDGLKTLHGFTTNGFPNCFFLGFTQGAVTVNVPHALNEQAKHISHLLAEVRTRGEHTVEATPEGEQGWLDEVQRTSRFGERFRAECTPGYYNNEGKQANPNGFFTSGYGGGPIKFFRILEQWRENGTFDGVKIG